MKQLFIIVSLFVLTLTACSTDDNMKPTGEKTAVDATTTTNSTSNNPRVKIETTMGDIVLELDGKNAPLSTENFLSYVKDGHYNGVIFHRVMSGFMIQGGGMNPDMSEKSTKASIKNEANNGLKNDRGTLAMARTGDPHSASSQFFINLVDNGFLNFTAENQRGWGYAVFGKVVDGMDTVDKIAAVETGNRGGHGDVPKEPIVMTNVTVVE